jgi:hypothetical protein
MCATRGGFSFLSDSDAGQKAIHRAGETVFNQALVHADGFRNRVPGRVGDR